MSGIEKTEGICYTEIEVDVHVLQDKSGGSGFSEAAVAEAAHGLSEMWSGNAGVPAQKSEEK